MMRYTVRINSRRISNTILNNQNGFFFIFQNLVCPPNLTRTEVTRPSRTTRDAHGRPRSTTSPSGNGDNTVNPEEATAEAVTHPPSSPSPSTHPHPLRTPFRVHCRPPARCITGPTTGLGAAVGAVLEAIATGHLLFRRGTHFTQARRDCHFETRSRQVL